MRRLWRICRWIGDNERGSGIVEFVLLAVVVFVPLTYGVLAFSSVQETVLAATDAARQAGRAMANAPDSESAMSRAQYAATLAAQTQNVDTAGMQVWAAPSGSDCEDASDAYAPALDNLEVFAVCVQIPIRLPLLPDVLSANTATGKYVVTMGAFR